MSANEDNKSDSRQWIPSIGIEQKRLAVAQAGWKLAGGTDISGRTRGNNKKTPPLAVAAASPADDVSALTIPSSASPRGRKKPPSSRVIVDVDAFIATLETHLSPCPQCGARLEVTFPTVCLASSCRLTCPNYGPEDDAECKFIVTTVPESAGLPLLDDAGSQKIVRNTDHAVNILFVLAFIASGDGGTEAARLLGLLGLPNCTTMQSRSFGSIEATICPIILRLADRIVYDNLCKEVELTLGDAMDDDNNNRLYDLWKKKELPEDLWPRVKASTDMGWQQKGSGRRYNSQSGHCFFCGANTRLVIAKVLCSKACAVCKSWYTTHPVDEEPPDHSCFINHEGSSGSMEPKAVLELYEMLYAQQVVVAVIVCDDDSSIKAKLKWSNADHMTNHGTNNYPTIVNSKGNVVRRPDHGKLQAHMPEPVYVADPNHRRKTLAGELYGLKAKNKTSPEEKELKEKKAAAKKAAKEAKKAAARTMTTAPLVVPDGEKKPAAKKSKKDHQWNMTMTGMDCMRISKNFAFMARTLENKTSDEEILAAGKSVLEHHFDCHDHCGLWCRRKLQTEEERKKHYYRSKTKDAELYKELTRILSRFITLEALKEVAHAMDTLVNESMNNTISWIAPKNKVYCGTASLATRIAIAIGITTLGTMRYYNDLFRLLGIRMTEDVAHWLQIKDGNRAKRLTKVKTQRFKRHRKKQYYSKLKEEIVVAKTERSKRDGVYKSGIGMAGGYSEEAAAATEDSSSHAPRAKRSKPIDTNKICSACGEVGHARRTSKQCKYYAKRSKRNDEDPAAAATLYQSHEDADELDAIDAMPFDADTSGDDNFEDARDYWSSEGGSIPEDDEGDVVDTGITRARV